ncbi:MAG: Mur ligase family protein [Lachnospiraceae bacterium]|nr:Mur ligase family protein [Lachnospiraceae bacterium]
MTYQEAVIYIVQIPKFTSKNDLHHTRKLLKYLGDPQDKLKVIHVAGTNGKGSVCTYVDALLRCEGKTVGRFTSPHLEVINERMIMNNQMITDVVFLQVFQKVLRVVEQLKELGYPHPTFFEFLFAMALVAFVEEKIEYAVLETGMGGRLDATNVVEAPIMTIITAIGYDHMEHLGDTLTKIAGEKAGIIKRDVPLVYADTAPASNGVMEKRAKELNAPCMQVCKKIYVIQDMRVAGIRFTIIDDAYEADVLWTLKNVGIYQPHNAVLAVEAMRVLFPKADLRKWRTVLSQIVWPGRMELLLPNIIVDGAHNLSAVQGFVDTVKKVKEYRASLRKVLVFAVTAEKEYKKMIALLCKELDFDVFVVTRLKGTRGVTTEQLAKVFRTFSTKPVIIKHDMEQALVYVQEEEKKSLTYCLGSLYLVGELRCLTLKKN